MCINIPSSFLPGRILLSYLTIHRTLVIAPITTLLGTASCFTAVLCLQIFDPPCAGSQDYIQVGEGLAFACVFGSLLMAPRLLSMIPVEEASGERSIS